MNSLLFETSRLRKPANFDFSANSFTVLMGGASYLKPLCISVPGHHPQDYRAVGLKLLESARTSITDRVGTVTLRFSLSLLLLL